MDTRRCRNLRLQIVFNVGDVDAQQRMHDLGFALLIGTGVGFYDGFFGPGTGSFFAFAFVALLGYNLRRATAGTKVLNFTSNIASLLFFASQGLVLWQVGLLMGAAQMAGAQGMRPEPVFGARYWLSSSPRYQRELPWS